MATNVALYSIREELFHRPAFHSSLLALDTFVITISLIVNGKVDSEFFLTYFFLIIVCCFFESFQNRRGDLDPGTLRIWRPPLS